MQSIACAAHTAGVAAAPDTALHILKMPDLNMRTIQELHALQVEAGQGEQAHAERAEAEVERLKAELEGQQRQAQQVCPLGVQQMF